MEVRLQVEFALRGRILMIDCFSIPSTGLIDMILMMPPLPGYTAVILSSFQCNGDKGDFSITMVSTSKCFEVTIFYSLRCYS